MPVLIAIIILFSSLIGYDAYEHRVTIFQKFNIKSESITPSPTEILTPTKEPTVSPTSTIYAITPTIVSQNNINNNEWGVTKQISKHTFVQQVANDAKMATVNEIFVALNNYRNNYGKSSLSWNNNLASWANSRAQSFAKNNSLDEHAGFFSEAETKSNEFGFSALNEGSSFIGKLEATHYIEWILTGDAPHKEAMLRNTWNSVGIGLSSNDGYRYGVDIIYGKTK